MVAGKLEHLVCGIRRHQVSSRTDVGGVRTLRDELQLERVATGGDAVGAGVICSIDRAVRCARFVVLACGGVPLVASVAVGVSICDLGYEGRYEATLLTRP